MNSDLSAMHWRIYVTTVLALKELNVPAVLKISTWSMRLWGTALILSWTHPSRTGIKSKEDRVFLVEGGQSALAEGASLKLFGVFSHAHSEERLLRWTLLSNLSSLKSWLLCYVWLSFWRSLSVKKSPRFFVKGSGNSAHPRIWILVFCFAKNLWV